MNTKFEQSIERPLRFFLNRELLEERVPIPSSRSFGSPETGAIAPIPSQTEAAEKKCADGKPCQNACCTASRERPHH